MTVLVLVLVRCQRTSFALGIVDRCMGGLSSFDGIDRLQGLATASKLQYPGIPNTSRCSDMDRVEKDSPISLPHP